MKQDYPRYISSKPCGDDKTKGEAQRRLVAAIANHIISKDTKKNAGEMPRIIGLRGEWGSGKSNVIKQLKEKDAIKKTYYVYEFDAWGHQEDPLRRSFLESLTNDLLLNKVLPENKKIVESSIEKGKMITWRDKLNEILAHQHITKTNNMPIIDGGSVWVFLAILLMPVAAFVADLLHDDKIIENIWWLTFIVFSPALLLIAIWSILYFCDKKRFAFGKLLQLSKLENSRTVNEETIYEDEPTVAKFQKWMKDLSDYLGTINRRLIVVFDNMDRLPAEKVRELWSSIHTFFAETGYENIWTIIPYDEKHLAEAFNENIKEHTLTKQFVSKSLPIVYRVTKPVGSDLMQLYEKMYTFAFDQTEDEQKELTYRIYRILKRDDSVRALVEFINSLVSYKRIWEDEIPLSHIAIFTLKEDALQEGAAEKILSGSYLDANLQSIVPNDESLQISIAMLYYGVDKEMAKQIPLKTYIGSCLTKEGNDINLHSDKEWFVSALVSAIDDRDKEADLEDIINGLARLDRDKLSDNDDENITKIWSTLAALLLKKPLIQQRLDSVYQEVMDNVDIPTRLKVCRHFIKEVINFKEFDGAAYYESLSVLDAFVKESKWDIDVVKESQNIPKPEIKTQTFVQYVLAAENNYKLYGLSVDSKELSDYLQTIVTSQKPLEELQIISYLIEDEAYDFDKVRESIAKRIEQKGITEENFYHFISTYKVLEPSRPLPIQLDPAAVQQLSLESKIAESSLAEQEIHTMMVAKGIEIPKLPDSRIPYIARNVHYYATFTNLLLLRTKTQAQKKVLKYMIENRIGTIVKLSEMLPNIDGICTELGITLPVMLDQIDNWEVDYKDLDAIELPKIIVKPEFFAKTKEVETRLVDYLFARLVDGVKLQEGEVLKGKLGTTDYWAKGIEILLDSDYAGQLKDKTDELGALILQEPLENPSMIPAEGSIKARIIDKMDKRKAKGASIRNKFCNEEVVMTPQLFAYYHTLLESFGLLEKRAEGVVQFILEPVIDNADTLKLILEKKDFYVHIIQEAGDYATSLKEKLANYAQRTEDEDVKAFAFEIGAISEENEDSDESPNE